LRSTANAKCERNPASIVFTPYQSTYSNIQEQPLASQEIMARANKNAPLMLFFYNLALATLFLPELYTYLNLSISLSLLLQTIVTTSFFSTIAYLGIGTVTLWSGLFYKLFAYLLQRFLDLNLSDHLPPQLRLLKGVEDEQSRIELYLGIALGISTTIYLFKKKAGSWKQAKRNVEQSRLTQTLAKAEQGGLAKEIDAGSPWWWAACTYIYAEAWFGSKDWLEGVLRGSEVERTVFWDRCCFFGSYLVAGVVGFIRWRWIVKAREGKVLEEKVTEEKEDVGGKQVSEK
jgi:hypothetical protein